MNTEAYINGFIKAGAGLNSLEELLTKALSKAPEAEQTLAKSTEAAKPMEDLIKNFRSEGNVSQPLYGEDPFRPAPTTGVKPYDSIPPYAAFGGKAAKPPTHPLLQFLQKNHKPLTIGAGVGTAAGLDVGAGLFEIPDKPATPIELPGTQVRNQINQFAAQHPNIAKYGPYIGAGTAALGGGALLAHLLNKHKQHQQHQQHQESQQVPVPQEAV